MIIGSGYEIINVLSFKKKKKNLTMITKKKMLGCINYFKLLLYIKKFSKTHKFPEEIAF